MTLCSPPVASDRTTIVVAICTFKRNDLLTRLLDALVACAERVRVGAAVGIVLVDDTPEGLAEPVADTFATPLRAGSPLQNFGPKKYLSGSQSGHRNRHGGGETGQ